MGGSDARAASRLKKLSRTRGQPGALVTTAVSTIASTTELPAAMSTERVVCLCR